MGLTFGGSCPSLSGSSRSFLRARTEAIRESVRDSPGDPVVAAIARVNSRPQRVHGSWVRGVHRLQAHGAAWQRLNARRARRDA